MKEIRIEYPVLFFFRKTKMIQVPEEWIDLTGRQFAVCCSLFTEPLSDVMFISKFFGIKKSLAKRLGKFYQYKLIELAEFVANPKAMVNFFYLQEIRGTGLKAPDKRLHGVTFERFMLFDTLFFDYMNDRKEESLAKFIAILYLKETGIFKKKTENATDIYIDKRVKFIMKNVDKSTQYAIFLNYSFIRKWLSKPYPFLFGFTEEEDDDKKKPVRLKKPNRTDWNAILDGLVGDDIIHHEQYTKIPCTVAFKTINNRIKNYNKYGK